MADIFLRSEYTFSLQYTEVDTGRVMLTDPNPIDFLALDDNIPHRVTGEERLWGIADKYYGAFPRPAGLWKAVADFNNIYDPTLLLEDGEILYIPSARTLDDIIYSSTRYSDFDDTIG